MDEETANDEWSKAERIRRANIVFTGQAESPPPVLTRLQVVSPMHVCPLCGSRHNIRKAGP